MAQSADTLLSTENVHVDAGGAVRAAGPTHQLAGTVGREAVVEPLELAGVDLDPVLQAEQALEG